IETGPMNGSGRARRAQRSLFDYIHGRANYGMAPRQSTALRGEPPSSVVVIDVDPVGWQSSQTYLKFPGQNSGAGVPARHGRESTTSSLNQAQKWRAGTPAPLLSTFQKYEIVAARHSVRKQEQIRGETPQT